MATVNLSWTNTTTGGTTSAFKIWRWTGDLVNQSGSSGGNDDAYVIANGTPIRDDTHDLSTYVGTSGENYAYADTGLASSSTYNYVLQAYNTSGESASATSTDASGGAVATVVVS